MAIGKDTVKGAAKREADAPKKQNPPQLAQDLPPDSAAKPVPPGVVANDSIGHDPNIEKARDQHRAQLRKDRED